MIGVKHVADVFRTLDKMSMRKEYHTALAKQWLTFDYIVSGIKKIADGSMVKDDVKLKAYTTLLKSLGMDKYEESSSGGWSWEDLLIDKSEKKIDEIEGPKQDTVDADYEVVKPEMPERLKKKKEEETADAHRLYE